MKRNSSLSATSLSRRKALWGGAAVAAAATSMAGLGNASAASNSKLPRHDANHTRDFITVTDGTRIFYKDWGTGAPVVFSHGWPLDADAWDSQMLFLLQHGYRVIAHDRRGHGRSSQTSSGNDMDTYADDLAALMDALDINGAMMVGHSTGGGEVARYIGRHGSRRVKKVVLIGAVPPIMVKTEQNPGGLPVSTFDGIRNGVSANRSQFYRDLAIPFYGYNRPNAKVSQAVVDEFWREGMLGGIKGQYECIKQFSEVDYTEDLKKINVPTLILHGDDDQIVPIADAGMLSEKIVKSATLKVYQGAPHGMCTTEADRVNADLLEFVST
ncbi:alpha/beta fold hydrolase [Paraburkholderia sp. SOS3]|uniref:alpha/beta fold hydrolase n=1 Tax=Paraburkholderia sp. SOS3 TaxID=1926494 RepID=UPI0009F9D02F|nr:alpha/beta hydrolase [Paraburkholderia sp. SOS3]